MTDISDSGFIAPHTISTNWSDIALFQQRNHNMLYHAKRYGKYFVLKGLSAACQSITEYLFLQEKEFALGVSLTHPHIAETYSLEEVEGCGRCIVMEYVDGTTLVEWLSTNPSTSVRQRVMMQLLDALEYIHSLQLVHYDLKSSNILITRNGQNVKLIDFGLSQTDDAHLQNDVQVDIDQFAQVLSLIFPKRYQRLRLRCQKHQFANISALRASIEHQERTKKYIPYFVAIIILIFSVLLSIHTYRIYQESEQMATAAQQYMIQKHREQEMIEKVHFNVTKELEPLQIAANSMNTYFEFTQHPLYMGVWQKQMTTRDSIADLYADDPALRLQCIETWTLIFGERFMQFDNRIKQDKLNSTTN